MHTYSISYLVEALVDLTQVERGTPVSLFHRQGLKRLPWPGAVHALRQQEQEISIGGAGGGGEREVLL